MAYYLNNNIYKIINNVKYSTLTNLPMCNISWYEAKAYCKYMGYKLPSESILEYCSTNGGITKYPWGNNNQMKIYVILDLKNIVSVLDKVSGKNKKYVSFNWKCMGMVRRTYISI